MTVPDNDKSSNREATQPADYKGSRRKKTGKYDQPAKVVFRKYLCAKIHLKSPFTITPGYNYIGMDGAFYIRSERWKRAAVFDILDSTQFLRLYQDENFASLSLIYSIDKLSASPSPLFMLCLVTVACLSV